MKKTIASHVGAEEALTQHAALCHRPAAGGHEVLLVTSRDTGRWILPKGWPVRGKSGATSALQEAYEEAGVSGRADKHCVGVYGYDKIMDDGRRVACMVSVFAVRVQHLADSFPECGQRRRAWLSPADAAARVAEPELADLILRFRP
jgi:8-oxo-dGTP pyrophosphatase MutT (NUDIX family)